MRPREPRNPLSDSLPQRRSELDPPITEADSRYRLLFDVSPFRTGGEYETGTILRRHDAPSYFEALEHHRVIAAHDARTDRRTCEFRDKYLVPYGIGAMLDVPLRHDNRTVGVLCAEHVGPARSWTVDEQNFAISAGNLIIVALAEEERRRALASLVESETRARLVVDTAHDCFIGIDSADRIVAWNAQSERTFGWTRTEAIGQTLADTIIPPAFREAHLNGMRRFQQTGEAPVLNQRLELTALHRSGREFPVELTISSQCASRQACSSGHSCATSPIVTNAMPSCGAPRNRRKRRRKPRASFSPT
jgi:PAS domain S-box-containing protein